MDNKAGQPVIAMFMLFFTYSIGKYVIIDEKQRNSIIKSEKGELRWLRIAVKAVLIIHTMKIMKLYVRYQYG